MTRIAIILSTFLAVTACQTIEGAGEDIGSAGDAIADESREVQAQN